VWGMKMVGKIMFRRMKKNPSFIEIAMKMSGSLKKSFSKLKSGNAYFFLAGFKINIGFVFKSSKFLKYAFAILAILPVLIDYAFLYLKIGYWDYGDRFLMIVPFVLLYIFAAKDDLQALGFRLIPEQGWKHWLKVAAILGFIIGLLIVIFSIGVILSGNSIKWHDYVLPPFLFWERFVHSCILASLLEEMIYRFLFCVPMVNVIGKPGTIIVNGFIFATLHALYGNLNIDNFVAGFILSWAFLRSNSILVPIFFHFIGNFSVLIIHMLIYSLL
jgi:membrane protease YdiL (CAAX protease family)